MTAVGSCGFVDLRYRRGTGVVGSDQCLPESDQLSSFRVSLSISALREITPRKNLDDLRERWDAR